MTQVFLQGCKGWRKAKSLAPWAQVFIRVDGGYMAFASKQDWQLWKRQK